MLISLNVCCGQNRSEAAKIEEVIAHDKVIAHDTLSGWRECISEFNLTIAMGHTLLHIGGFNIKIDKIKTENAELYSNKTTFEQANLKEIIKFCSNTAHS
jgi:hypothetical protein